MAFRSAIVGGSIRVSGIIITSIRPAGLRQCGRPSKEARWAPVTRNLKHLERGGSTLASVTTDARRHQQDASKNF